MRSIPVTTWLILSVSVLAYSHPAGNMVKMGDKIFWSYVSPVGDIDHHAAIMVWDQHSAPEVFLSSEHSSSDFLLHVSGDTSLYILERRTGEGDTYIQLLHADREGKIKTLRPWLIDKNRLGEGGFSVTKNGTILFARYPDILMLAPDGSVTPWRTFPEPIVRIRRTDSGQILALSEAAAFLISEDGEIEQQWKNIVDPEASDPPLNRNVNFDADFKDGKLLLAYWGGRSFIEIDNGQRREIYSPGQNYVPHWVLITDKGYLLFSSNMDFNNPFTPDGERSTITPWLILHTNTGNNPVWTIPTN